jgi:hypothetical protein
VWRVSVPLGCWTFSVSSWRCSYCSSGIYSAIQGPSSFVDRRYVLRTGAYVVSTMTRKRAGRWRIRVPARVRDSCFSKRSKQALTTTHPLIPWVRGIERPERETDYSFSFIASPYTPSCVYRNKTFITLFKTKTLWDLRYWRSQLWRLFGCGSGAT